MPVFTYRAADRRGQTIDGVMEAVDARAVAEQLRKDSYYPIKVAPQSERASLLTLGGASSRVRQRDLMAMTQMLSAESLTVPSSNAARSFARRCSRT